MNAYTQVRRAVVFGVIVGLACLPASAVTGWVPVTVPNGDFETSGTDTSWSDGGYAGLSGTATDYAGDVAKNILPGWQYAAGPTSKNSMSNGTRVTDSLGTHGQVAQINITSATNKTVAGYITSEVIPGVTIAATRYELDVWHRATGSNYGVIFGFMYGALGGQADVTTSWLETPSNNKWGAPYEVNAGHNTRQEGARADWVHTTVYWDNTGTMDETFGITWTGGDTYNGEGYKSATLPDGTMVFAYYTKQRGVGEGMRLGSYVRGSGTASGSIFLDGFQVAVEGEPTPQWHPGDANKDGTVDLQDFGLLKDHFGATENATWEQGDFNGDFMVDLQDFGILKDHFGHTTGDTPVTAIPEPATAVILLAAAGAAWRKRRR